MNNFNVFNSWSFGVLLYEIVTLGRTPYPHIQCNEDVVKHLQAEYRMEKPTNCSDVLYQLMRSCWETDPERRPTFEQITDRLQAISHLANKTGEEHIRLTRDSGRQFDEFPSVDRSGPTVLLIMTNEQEEAEMSYLTPICT